MLLDVRDGLAVFAVDETVSVHRVPSATQLTTFYTVGHDPTCLHLHGLELYTGAADGSIRRWCLESGRGEWVGHDVRPAGSASPTG